MSSTIGFAAPPFRGDGVGDTKVPRFVLMDIRELAFHHPDLVNVEPNGDAIVREIRSGNTDIKGLRCWVETVAGVRV